MPTQDQSVTATGNINVQHAFRLGWRFAQLYHDPHHATHQATTGSPLPPHLPPLSELSPTDRTELILREIAHDVATLTAELPADDHDPQILTTLLNVVRGNINEEGKKTQILDSFRELRIEIGADDARLGTAIDLGRMLADTVILADSPETYTAAFKFYRIQNAYEWLEDLHTSFPEHAADAVRGSLEYWAQWVISTGGVPPADQERRVRRSLTLQGERWRRLLSGEILAADLLTSDSYRAAASGYLRRIGTMAWSFVRRFWLAIALVLGGTAAIIWAILAYAPAGASSVAAVIATAIGSVGVSWKTVGSTLGKVAAKAEEPLWNLEVLEAIVMATLIPPVQMNRRTVASLRKQKGQLPELEAAPEPPGEAQPAPPATQTQPPAPATQAQPPTLAGEEGTDGQPEVEHAPAGLASGELSGAAQSVSQPGGQ